MQKFHGVYIYIEAWVRHMYIAYTCMYNMVAVTMYIYIYTPVANMRDGEMVDTVVVQNE